MGKTGNVVLFWEQIILSSSIVYQLQMDKTDQREAQTCRWESNESVHL